MPPRPSRPDGIGRRARSRFGPLNANTQGPDTASRNEAGGAAGQIDVVEAECP